HRDRRAGRIRDAGAGIADVDGEDPLALSGRRNARDRGHTTCLPLALIVGEEEGTVLHDRSPDDATELAAVDRRLAVRWPEEAGRIQRIVAQELPGAAVERIRAAAVADVNRRTSGPTVLGAHVIGHDLELADSIRRRLHHLVR